MYSILLPVDGKSPGIKVTLAAKIVNVVMMMFFVEIMLVRLVL